MLGCSFASCKYCLPFMWSNWWTSARWLANLTRYLAPPMKSDSFREQSCKPCWQFDGWTQMTSILQIFRLYRVLERPKPGQNSLNQATIAQRGQRETNGPFLVMCLVFLIHRRGCRVSVVIQQFSILESSSLLSVITNNSAWLKSFDLALVIGIAKFQICYLLHKFTIIVINDHEAKTNQ